MIFIYFNFDAPVAQKVKVWPTYLVIPDSRPAVGGTVFTRCVVGVGWGGGGCLSL